ncbi:GFA family protein [Neoroseomonas lacus]|uniref:Aldehyde-activating protein n=1 Tax=Neoroseomonas lacus TaxID=287609 RepID=A0A917NIM4_9PROT|nr:GFA family protein [Neoroseomonas lacus]GGJ03647.1 aldehyde-activating protein [Neoroseomonas lacus]
MTAAAHIAACACGQLRAECRGERRLVSLCHCLDCQRRTGSAFGIAAFFGRDDVTNEGRASACIRRGDSGHALRFHFCPDCGSTVFWEPERRPGDLAVAVGAFADPGFPAPAKSVFEHRRHPWIQRP